MESVFKDIGKNFGELTDKNKPMKKTFEKVESIYKDSADLKTSSADATALENAMSKMWGRFEENNCQTMVDKMFLIAKDKMTNEEDKKVLMGLRSMVRAAENTLYKPQSRF